MIAFLAAVQFLLVSPAFVRREFSPRELGRATGFYPLVGLLLGALLVLADILMSHVFPVQVRSAVLLALWIMLTGALHFDGFLDACDGLLGGATPERRLEIMRDERTGAYALAGGALLLLIMFSSLGAISTGRWAALLLAPVLGRCGLTAAVVAFPYARPSGLGTDVKAHAGAAQLLIAGLTTLAVLAGLTWALRNYAGAGALLTSGLVWWLGARFVLRRVPGMTGDTYGALNMLIEATALLTFVALQ
jgi:adenosylcobinamide-GDP ribazoletransferase